MSRKSKSSKGRKRLSLQERRDLIRAYRQTEQTQQEFCVEHGIGLSTLGKWLRDSKALKGKPKTSGILQEVVVSGSVGHPPAVVEVISPHGWKVRFGMNQTAQTVRQWLEALPC